jgi:hypothetical protein
MGDEMLRGGKQSTVTGEPHAVVRPQPFGVETGDIAQGVVPAAVRVAGEVVKFFELAGHGDRDVSAEGLFEFSQGGDLVTLQPLTEGV